MSDTVDPQLIRCRILTAGSFLINLAAQLYGMFAKPNIKDIADANHYAFSPNPFFIAGFFALQLGLQLYWIQNLFVWRSSPSEPKYDHRVTLPGGMNDFDPAVLGPPARATDMQPAQVAYAPIFALGNLCIAGWMLLWRHEHFAASEVLCALNAAAQLYAVFYLLAPATPFALAKGNVSTHLVARTFAGIAVLDVLDNGAVALRYAAPPSVLAQVLAVALLALLALVGDVIFASCMVYISLGLLAGQPDWRPALIAAAGITGFIAVAKAGVQWRGRRAGDDGRVIQ